MDHDGWRLRMSKMKTWSRFAGGIDTSEDVHRWLPTMAKLTKTLKSKDVALLSYIFEYLKKGDKDRGVSQLADALATEYAKRFAEWLGYVFLNRAQRRRGKQVKQMKAIEMALGNWVEAIPDMLRSGGNRPLSDFVDKDLRYLNFATLDRIGAKVLRVVWTDYQAAQAGKTAARRVGELPIEYDRRHRVYVIADSGLAYKFKRQLHDLGFKWNAPRKVWVTDTLNSGILKAFPTAKKLPGGRSVPITPPKVAPPKVAPPRAAPPKTVPLKAVPPLNLRDWFFGTWMPKNITRFDKVFNDYGKSEGVPYEFRFSVKGDGVDVLFTRHIKTLAEAITEMERRYRKAGPDREGWREALDTYKALKKATGKAAIHAVDKANNLEHSHGSMMEHFPPGVRSWYPQFLDFKFTAGIWQMIKAVRDQDLRDIAGALMPGEDQLERIAPPKIDHRTAKGIAMEIASQPGKRNKQKYLIEMEEKYPDLYPDVLENLAEKGLALNDEIRRMIDARQTAKVAHQVADRYIRRQIP